MKKNDCIKNLIKAIKDNTEWTKDENGNGLGLINREYINEEIEVLETKLKGLN